MTDCAQRAAAIDAAALGEPPSRELARHLATCAACGAQLERRRVLAQRIDAAVAAYVGTESPDGLVERIVARASHQRAQRRPARLGVRIGFAAALAGALVAGAGLAEWRTMRQATDIGAIAAWQSPTASLLISHDSVLGTRFTLPRRNSI